VPYSSGVAVPLREPDWQGPESAEGGREIGLFFIIPMVPWRRETLLRLGRRLAPFVTRRWRRQWEVNQRIHTDSLTGVHNRAYFDTQFVLELERAKRRGGRLSLIMGDLDHFKQINDTHGHETGDRVLQLVAQEMKKELRRIDHICRIGGEEFALILPDTGAGDACDVVVRLLQRIARIRLRVPDRPEPLRITISFGGVSYPDGGSDALELNRKADAMLYRSKEAGRNRCSFWRHDRDPETIVPDA
jgi:diguanylate cyclase (GGDEF)-like protein